MSKGPTWKFKWTGVALSYRPSDGIDPPPGVTANLRKLLIEKYGNVAVEGTFDGDGKLKIGEPSK